MSKNNSSSKKTVARSSETPAKRVRRGSATAIETSLTETRVSEMPAAVEMVDTVAVSHDQVAALAYRFFVEGGYQHGHALDHWLRAESALRAR